MQGATMWKPQVTPLAEMRSTAEGPVITRTSLTTQKQEFRTVSNKYNSQPAPFQLGNKKMVNPGYNTPMAIYSDDAIAETLSAQAEVLGQGVIGVNFMKNEKTFEGHKSDVLKMVQEMDSTPRSASPGIVMCPSPSPNLQEHTVQGQSFKLLERALAGEPTHSPASPGAGGLSPGVSSVLKPGENICYVCGSLIVGVFVRIKNKNLHEHCFKCATCGMSLKNKGYYHVNDKPYCDIHAASAARQNPPGPNLEPITIGPGSPLPAGALTTSQAKLAASKFSPHSPSSPKIQPPSSSSLYRPPAGGVKIMPSIPTPAPYKPGTELLLKECDHLATMPTAQQIAQESTYKTESDIELMEQMLPKTSDHIVKQIEYGAETKSSQVVESSVRITTEEKKIIGESMSAGSQVSISGGGETKASTQFNMDTSKATEMELLNNVDKHDIVVASEQLTDGHQVHIEEQNMQNKSLIDKQQIGEDYLHQQSTEAVIPLEEKPHIEPTVSVADKNEQPSSVVKLENKQTDLSKTTSSFQNVHNKGDTGISKIAQSQDSVVVANKTSSYDTSLPNPVLGLPDLSTMQLGSTQKSSSTEYAKQESKMVSSATEQYTASSSCYQSFGAEHKSSSSSSGMKVTENTITPASSALFAPSPISPAVASPTKHVTAPFAARSAGIGNQQVFGAPSGDINVRAHIPKKGPAPPSFMPEVPQPSSMIPSPLFDLPKPAMPPGAGPQRGIALMPGQRSAPKRGRGIINPASVSRVPMCSTCQRQIRGPFVSALGKTWCPDCFVCATSNCRRPLINLGFVEEKGGLHCEDCYERYLAPSCGKCDKKIKGDCLNAISKHFHPECFCCAYCGKIFGSGAFYLEDGLPYCEADWNDLFTTKCVGCKFPIEAGDRWVEALNNNYHSQCFICSVCKSNLEGKSFYAKNGRPFCKAHASR